MEEQFPRCSLCGHLRSGHRPTGCLVQKVSGPPTPNATGDHAGRIVTTCGCTGFVL